MTEQDPKFMTFDYVIKFERTNRNYRLSGYNTPWNGAERELEDLRLIFEGKDLSGAELPHYKLIEWEKLAPGDYTATVEMILYKPKDGPHEQLFKLKSLEQS